MNKDSTYIDADLLADLDGVFHRSDFINSNSMLHGLLCALLSHPLEIEKNHWYKHLESIIDHPSQKEQRALIQYAEHIKLELQDDDYKLRLPKEFDDDQTTINHSEEYRQKAIHIANWIDGYIYGYAVSPSIQSSKEDEHINEWLSFLQESQRVLQKYIGTAEEEPTKKTKKSPDSKENEKAEYDLNEITEFIRISIYLSQNIWHQNHEEETVQPLN